MEEQVPGSSNESAELELLERVFLRLGNAGTDAQLQSTLERFLVPIILKSGSEFKSVQDKVLEILTHVNRRLQSRPEVQLPLEPLLALFTNKDASPQATNFSLVYVKQGFTRLAGDKKAKLLPDLVSSLEGKRPQQQDIILRLLPPSLTHLVLPKDLSKRKETFSLQSRPQTRNLLLEFLHTYLLLPYGVVDMKSARAPAGLSWRQLERLTVNEPLKPDQLEKVKMSILRFLSSEIFTANECVSHFIVAAADPKHSVADEGDHLLKQFGSSADVEEAILISHLYSLYLGTVATPGKRPHPQSHTADKKPHPQPPDPKDTCSPAPLRLRLRLMPYFTKSTLAANSFPSTVQVIFDNLFGVVTNAKLKILSLHFIQHICSRASEAKLNVMAPVLLTGLNKIISQPPEDPKLHCLSYVAIGTLAKKAPFLFVKDTKHLSRIFNNAQKDFPQDLGLAIQECLSLMSAAYRGVKGQHEVIVEALILENIYSEATRARLAAVKYAMSVFPFHHVPSRFACMLACGDSKEEVREDGRKGLIAPPADNVMGWDAQSRELPDFSSMLGYLHKRAKLSLESSSAYRTAAGVLPFHPRVLMEGVRFLRACLSQSAGVTAEQKLLGVSLPRQQKYFMEISSANDKCLMEYLYLLKVSLGPAGDGDLHSVAMEALLELTAAAPSSPPVSIRDSLRPDLQWIKGFTHSSRAETREPAAALFGLLAQDTEPQVFIELAEQVLKDTFDLSYSVQHGGMVTLGHVTAVLVISSADTQTSTKPESAEYVRKAVRRLVELAKAVQNVQLATSACKALGNVFSSGPLPFPTGVSGCGKEAEQNGDAVTKTTIVECLAGIVKSAKQPKLKEHCTLTLGCLSLGEPDFPLKQEVMAALLSLKEEKAVELQFSVGEAMAATLAGPLCSLPRETWTRPSTQDKSGVTFDLDILPRTLDSILTSYAVGTSPIVRQSSCVWLLSLLKHAGKHPGIQSHLKRIQLTFMDLLTEQSEVTQEVASRGMGLVYDMSAEEGRGELVEMLVGTLMEGRKSSVKVTDDTKLFMKGQLGKVPEGGSLSTYKELCSLASDMNRPDLVYKFMSLANHSALWNSKKGAAYGFSSIASHAQEQLAPYLSSIVPRLYRYKYDPSPGVQLAMSNIWSAIVPESKKAMDHYLKEIMADLLLNLNSSLWRNRQSSCSALSDLLGSRQVGEVADDIPQLWELVLRVRDDIKETVRKAADSACESLHKITVRACDGVTMTTTGVKVVEGVLPILLKHGLTNPSDEIKAIGLRSILKISKNAGVLLKPHIATLVPSLLESLSSLEHQKLNTYSMMFNDETEVREKLDELRVSASKSSPMMETVRLCVQQVGAEELVPLVPRLVEVMKRGVGLSTKAAAAQLVVLLVHHCLHMLTPFAGKLMSGLVTCLSDRNTAVRRANARAIGHLIKVSKDTTITKTITKLKAKYFEKDDSPIQSSVAYVFHAMATYSLDTTRKFSSDILPFVFLAMHAKPSQQDEDEGGERFEAVVAKWKATWEELVPSTSAAVKLNLQELVEMVCFALQSQSWAVKKQGAAAIATIADTMGAQLHPPHLNVLLASLLDALQGRTWEGKDMLLKALSTMCKSCSETLKAAATMQATPSAPPATPSEAMPPLPEATPPVLGELVGRVAPAVLGQSRKKEVLYKTASLVCLGDVVEALGVDVFSQVYQDIILPIVSKDSKSGDDSDEEDRHKSTTAKLDLQVKAFLLLGQTWPLNPTTQGEYYSKVLSLLTTSLPRNNWKLQLAILSSISSIYDRLVYILNEQELSYVGKETLSAVAQCIGEVKYSAVRGKALLSAKNMASYHKGNAGMELPGEGVALLVRTLQSVSDEQMKDQAMATIRLLSSGQ